MDLKRVAPLWLSSAFAAAGISAIRPYLGLYTSEIGGSAIDVGIVYAAVWLATMAARIPVGRLTDMSPSPKRIVTAGGVLMMLGVIVYLSAASPLIVALGSVLRGLGFAVYHVALLSIIVSLSRSESGIVLTAPPIGMSIGPGLSSLLFLASGFQGVFALSIGLLMTATLSSLFLPGPAPRSSDGGLGEEGEGEGGMAPFLVGRATSSFLMGTIEAILPLYAVSSLGFRSEEIGLLFLVGSVVNFLARPLATSRLYAAGRLMSAGLGASLLSVALFILLLRRYEAAWASMLFYGLGQGIFVPVLILLVGDVYPPGRRGAGMASLTLMIDVGGASGSMVSTTVYGLAGAEAAVLLAGLVSLAGIAVMAVSRLRGAA